MARELTELLTGRDQYELQYQSPSDLIDLLAARHLDIDLERAEAEYWIETLGYFHLKGYLSVLKEPVARENYRPGTKFSDAIELLLWEQRLRAVLLEQIGKVEVRLRSALVECIGHGHGDGYLLDENYDVSRLKNQKAVKQDRRSQVELSDWDWFVDWLGKRINAALHDQDYEFVRGHVNKRKNQHLPLWMLLEIMSLGDLLNFYERLSPKNRAFVASKLANPDAAGGQLKDNELARILEAIRTLRNMASHYHAFFNKRFPFPSMTDYRAKFRDSPYFPSVAAKRKACSTYEVILMLLYLEPAVQRDDAFSTEVAGILSDFPVSIQGVSDKTYGGHKGWSLDAPWRRDVAQSAGDEESTKSRRKQKNSKANYAKGKRRR